MNAKYTLYRIGKKLLSIEVSYVGMGITLCFRFKNTKNYWKTLKPETQEELEWLLYRATLEHVMSPNDSIYSYWDPWNPPRKEEDHSPYWVSWGERSNDYQRTFNIELDRDFLEHLRDDLEDDKFRYRLDQSIQRYKNYILGRKDKGRRFRSNTKHEDPFKYQKYQYVRK